MNRKISCISLIFFLLFLAGCGTEKKNFTGKDYSIGIIETNAKTEKSRLIFYDRELEEAGEKSLSYAGVGNIFYNPSIYEDELYIIPQGRFDSKDEKKVLKINLDNLDENTYEIDQLAMNSVCANGKYIYTCNTLNGDSYINRCKKETNEAADIKLTQIYISKLLCNNDKVFAFGTKKDDKQMRAFLYEFDKDLKEIGTYEITEFGVSHYKAILAEDDIYFSNSVDSEDNVNNTITVFSTQTHSFHSMALENSCPLDLAVYHNFLIISHYDLVRKLGGGISIYDTLTKEVKYIPLNHGAEQMAVSGDDIYILADKKLYKYHIENFDIIPEKNVDVKITNRDNYLSGLFTIEN